MLQERQRRDTESSPLARRGRPATPVLLLLGLSLQAAAGLGASSTANTLWVEVDDDALATSSTEERPITSNANRLFGLDRELLESLLAGAPMEFTAGITGGLPVIELPLPDGRLERFAFTESPVMHPELGAKYPEIRTYKGVSLDHSADLVRFDRTPLGFHAMILSPSGEVFIDPLRRGDTGVYQSYFKRDFRSDRARPSCLVEESVGKVVESAPATPTAPGTPVTFRQYRLAMAATGEYSVAICNHNAVPLTVANSLAGIVTTVNRINQVYERDLALRMVLVANNDQIIYTNSATDPYSGSPSTILNQNQTNLDSVIGSANYDIGHVVATGTGGVAGQGVVCVNGSKARGTTGINEPFGDPFDIDFVAHEIGHQFGANHTFNGTAGSCIGNRVASHAYEVGSGSTVLGFAGLCTTQDLQPNSDDYFHLESINEITTNVTTGSGTCSSNSDAGNLAPTVDAGAVFTIPSRTPFALTATGSDPNGDPLTYGWEEFDLGPAGSGTTDNGSSPILRSFQPTIHPRRGFPKLANVANGTSTYGELLPTTNRTMNFRVTARDNSVLGGGTTNDATTVTSVAVAGPFQITSQNTPVAWTYNTPEVITWDVAGTTGNGINTSEVRITLSLDGGRLFPFVLEQNVPNDGSETIDVPNVSTTDGRVQVEAVGNIFFDINNAPITITGGTMIFSDGFETGDTLDWSSSAP